jgi:hypothetical protein
MEAANVFPNGARQNRRLIGACESYTSRKGSRMRGGAENRRRRPGAESMGAARID